MLCLFVYHIASKVNRIYRKLGIMGNIKSQLSLTIGYMTKWLNVEEQQMLNLCYVVPKFLNKINMIFGENEETIFNILVIGSNFETNF